MHAYGIKHQVLAKVFEELTRVVEDVPLSSVQREMRLGLWQECTMPGSLDFSETHSHEFALGGLLDVLFGDAQKMENMSHAGSTERHIGDAVQSLFCVIGNT